jgi:NADH dehydrogenase (ubiquinone) flavoprotein 2
MSFAPDVESFSFAADLDDEIGRILARYPEARRQSAVMPLLHLAQKQHGGWLPRAALDHVAEFLGMPKIKVYEVASFYDMYNTVPTGRVQVRVCTTTPCWLCGSDDIVKAAKDTLGLEIGESSEDGRFFLREFECLGACCNAPMMWIDDDYYEDLDYDKAKAILEAFKRGEAPKPGPQSGRRGSEPAGERKTLLASRKTAATAEKTTPESSPATDQTPVRKGRPVDRQQDPTSDLAHAAEEQVEKAKDGSLDDTVVPEPGKKDAD